MFGGDLFDIIDISGVEKFIVIQRLEVDGEQEEEVESGEQEEEVETSDGKRSSKQIQWEKKSYVI